MNRPSYPELWQKYLDAQDTIADLADQLQRREMDIQLLQCDIQELEEILFAAGIFQHFDFD